MDPELSPISGRKPWKPWQRFCGVLAGVGGFLGLLWLTSAPDDIDNEHMRRARMEQDRVGEVTREFSGIGRDKASGVQNVGTNAAPAQDAGRQQEQGTGRRPPPGNEVIVRRVPITGFQGAAQQARASGAEAPAGSGPPAAPGGRGTEVNLGGAGAAGSGDRMSDQLRAGDDFGTAVASVLPDNDRFITLGTPMACDREGEVDTDQIGPFRCKVPAPGIFCKSGNAVCMKGGTWMVGVPLPLQRGQRRAFATIRRIETSDGCMVNLRSPVAGPMGAAGMDGDYHTHFLERFRGHMLIAGLDLLSQGAIIAASRAISGGTAGVNFFQFQGMGRQLGQGAFGDDVNIPPTFTSPPARRLVVMAMQDIDFRPCWRLATVNAGRK